MVATLCLGALVLFPAATAGAQALSVDRLANGTEVLLVSGPLAEASAACWRGADGEAEAECVMGSDLVFLGEVERALSPADPPSVVVVVGGPGRSALLSLLRRLFGDRPAAPRESTTEEGFEEGGQERRLGTLGSPSTLRLDVPLPPPDHPQRASVEVLWHLLPVLLRGDDPGLRSAINDDIASLETSLEPEIADSALQRIRLSLARLAGDPGLSEADVQAEARRLRIERQALLEWVEPAARRLLDLWRRGGADAVRHYLFGPDGVTLDSVRAAARGWLPNHPGRAVLTLPPRVFRPRFAPGPREVMLDNDLSAAVLERPAASLSGMVVRPVLLSGLAGDVEAVILARVAAALRGQQNRLPFVVVERRPPRLELATAADDFAALTEALQDALGTVAGDESRVRSNETARARALRLMAGVFGLDTRAEVSPSGVLAAENLAIGAVAPDAEMAVEALRKFGVGGAAKAEPLDPVSISGQGRRRMPASGTTAAVAAALYFEESFPIADLVTLLVSRRVEVALEGARVDVLEPLLPGRSAAVILIEREGSVDQLESDLDQVWEELFAAVSEEDLQTARRRVAAAVIDSSSGVLGRARVCAKVAAGEDVWREPAAAEMVVLTVELEAVNQALERLGAIEEREWTSSGPLPVVVPDE